MGKKIFMTAYNEKSLPSEDVLSVNGVSFKYDKPFFLICNYPIQDKAYFEFTVSDYYPIKAFRNVPLYVGIHKEPSFGVLNSDFIIGSLYYNVETTEYDIMSKYSKQFLNFHTHPEHIYSRRPGAQDVIGVGVDYSNNTVNVFVNGKLFYQIENKTYDEDGNVLTSFDLSSGTFYFCIWSNVYYKKILADFNENSGDQELERSKEIQGTINFGTTSSPYVPDGYRTMYSIYANYINPPDPEDEEEDPTDAVIWDPTPYEGMNNTNVYVGDNDNVSGAISEVTVHNPIDISVSTMALTCIDEDKDRVNIIDKYKYTMDATVDPDERYFSSGSTIYVNKPIPTEKKIYFEFYATEGQLKTGKIGIPISVGISGSPSTIVSKSSRTDLWHDQWYHYYWKEMNNSGTYEPDYVQHLHEIDNVFVTTSPEQGKVIGLAFNLAKNKMTVYVDNVKFYTMHTNRVVDRESEEVFTIIKNGVGYLTLIGNNGTKYQQTSPLKFKNVTTGVMYDFLYNSHSGRYDLYEEGGTLNFIPDDITVPGSDGDITIKSDTDYHMNGVHYTVYNQLYSTYLIFDGDDGTTFTQVKTDVTQRNNDGTYFELRRYEMENSYEYRMTKTHSTKYLVYSDLDYSKSYDFTYAFIHDEGAFNGTVKGSFNFGQEPFAATMPDGYMSLWDYYSLSNRVHVIQEMMSKINITNDRNIYASMPSLIKIVNSGKYIYGNDGINKMILNHNIVTDEEPYYYTAKGLDMGEFASMIARENNGYIPEEKMNSATISFEGLLHYTITIPNYAHQHIEASLNSKNRYITTFQAPKGAFISARVVADKGYTPGTLNLERFTVIEDTYLNASEASLTNYAINIIPTNNQYIEVIKIIGYNERTQEYIIDENQKYDSRTTTKFTTTIEDPDWMVRVIADYGYTAGKPNLTYLHVDKDVTVSAENAKINSYVVTIPNTMHQVVGVRFNQAEYLSNKIINESSDIIPVKFEVPYNSTVFIESKEVDLGYKIVGTYDTYKVIDRDTTIIVPTVVDDMCTITVNSNRFNGIYTISNSTKVGDNTYMIRRGDEVTITAEPADGLYVDTFVLE